MRTMATNLTSLHFVFNIPKKVIRLVLAFFRGFLISLVLINLSLVLCLLPFAYAFAIVQQTGWGWQSVAKMYNLFFVHPILSKLAVFEMYSF